MHYLCQSFSLERFCDFSFSFFNSSVLCRNNKECRCSCRVWGSCPAYHLQVPFFLVQKVFSLLVSCALQAITCWTLSECYYLDRVVMAKCDLSWQMVLLILTGIHATPAHITVTPTRYVVQELEIVSYANVQLASVEMEMFVMVSENFHYQMIANVAFGLLGMYWPSGPAIPAKWTVLRGWFWEG